MHVTMKNKPDSSQSVHIIMKNQTDPAQSMLCIERIHDHAEIIGGADPAHIQQLADIAKAIGAPVVYIIVPADALQEYIDAGWSQSTLVVVWKDLTDGKTPRRTVR